MVFEKTNVHRQIKAKYMYTIEELAQWVIDNRYPKNENQKVGDFEMFTTLVDKIKELQAKGSDFNH